jgi:polar amino acid transport system permease protein
MSSLSDLIVYRQALLNGLFVTLTLNIVVIAMGTLMSVVVAAMRLSPSQTVRAAGRLYVDLFRAIPILVLLVWIFFALPLASGGNLRFGPFAAATIALTLNLSAFGAEIVRAGIASVPAEHILAAQLAGFSRRSTWRHVTAPLALRTMLPPLAGLYINQVKLSVLASVIAVPELLHTVNTIAAETFRPLICYTTLAILFVAIVVPLTVLQGVLEARFKSTTTAPGLVEFSEPREKALSELVETWQHHPGDSVFAVREMTVGYGEATIVDGVSFAATAGGITGILGGNGSGKSTLLKALARIMPPIKGRVDLLKAGRIETQATSIGYMPQAAEPWPHLTVIGNLTLPLMVVAQCGAVEAEGSARLWLRALGLEEYAHSRADRLSGGQRQRLVLARLLCLQPAVVLLDEPTSALDIAWSRAIYGLLRMLASRGAILIVVSHAVSFVRDCANEVVFMHRGKVQMHGSVSTLLTAPEGEQLRSLLEAA